MFGFLNSCRNLVCIQNLDFIITAKMFNPLESRLRLHQSEYRYCIYSVFLRMPIFPDMLLKRAKTSFLNAVAAHEE